MSRPSRAIALQTPAGIYASSETETAYGGRTRSLSLTGTVWGDFRPKPPVAQSTGDGDAYVRQEAEFLCRSSVGLARGGVLNLKGFDWTILSLDEGADGEVRLRLERVHP